MTAVQFQDIHTGLMIITMQLVLVVALLTIIAVRRRH